MWQLGVVLFFNVLRLTVMDVISNRYCPDMRPQSYVSIEQLLGMWYGVELINHKQNEARIGIQYVDSCPVIHISEDHSPTAPPFFKGNIYYPYGTTYQDNQNQNQQRSGDYNNQGNKRVVAHDLRISGTDLERCKDPWYCFTCHGAGVKVHVWGVKVHGYCFVGTYGSYGSTNNYGTQSPQYGSSGHRVSTHYQGRTYGSEPYPKRYAEDIKRLRLLWTDNGGFVEYTLRYNTSKPGFWISSGPQNGSMLEPQYNQFAGTIQVIKAVGNHLVLTFCHQLPDQQLYTILLSRVPKLTRHEITDIHDLLTRRALETNNIKRVCSQNNAFNLHSSFVLLISIISANLFKIFS